MKHHTLAGQIKTIRENTRALRTYIQWKQCGTKAKYFKKSELEDKIFHLGVITQTTDKVKVSRAAKAQRRVFVGILQREHQAVPREAIIERLTKYAQESKNKFEKLKKEREEERKKVDEKRRSTQITDSKRDHKKIQGEPLKRKRRTDPETEKEDTEHRESRKRRNIQSVTSDSGRNKEGKQRRKKI